MNMLRTIGFSLCLGLSATAAAGPINASQNQQNDRIAQGVASGELTRRETATLIQEQRQIRAMEARFKSDGILTAGEFNRLRSRQAAASRHIYVQKHDAQQRG